MPAKKAIKYALENGYSSVTLVHKGNIQKFTEGYYFVINYTFEPSKISQLERHYKLNEEVIRYNILAK